MAAICSNSWAATGTNLGTDNTFYQPIRSETYATDATCTPYCPTDCPGHSGEVVLIIRSEPAPVEVGFNLPPPSWYEPWPPWYEKFQPPALVKRQWVAPPPQVFWRTPPRRRLRMKKSLGHLAKMKARRYSN